MADSYRRGPLCSVAQSPSFFNDGIENSVLETNPLYYDDTQSMGMLSQRGPIGEDLSASPGSEPLSTSGLNTLLRQIRQAVNSIELQDYIVTLLGPHCFATGVIAGIGMDILNSVNELLKLVQMFVLAELHDRTTDSTNWWQFGSIGMTGMSGMASMMIAQTIAGTFFAEELREAAKERDVFIKELGEALSDPQALFENITNAMDESYKKDWQDYNCYMNADTLEGRFRAGMICGRILVGILGLLTGIIGLGKLSAQLASKLPQLVKMAKTVKINPVLYKKPQQSIGVQGSKGSTAQTPTEVTGKSQVLVKSSHKGNDFNELESDAKFGNMSETPVKQKPVGKVDNVAKGGVVPNNIDSVATQSLTGKYARRTDVSYSAADDVNATFPAGWQPPYKPGTRVTEFETTVDDVYVRVHGENNKARSWMMKREALDGLSPEQIKSKYALPELPKYMSEVHVPAGTKVRTGTVNPLPAFDGIGNSTQYELLQRLPESVFKNTVRLGQ